MNLASQAPLSLTTEEELNLLLDIPVHVLADSDFYDLDIWYDLDNKNYLLFGDSNTRRAQAEDYWYVFYGKSSPDRRQICLKGLKEKHPTYIAELIKKHSGLSISDFPEQDKVYFLDVVDEQHNYFNQNYASFEGHEIVASYIALEAKANDSTC